MQYRRYCRTAPGWASWARRIGGPIGSVVRLRPDRRGAAAIFLALALAGLVGLAGLGTEGARWYFTKRAMQGAAD